VYGGPRWLDYPDLAVKVSLLGDCLDSGKVRERSAAEGFARYPLAMQSEEPQPSEGSAAADLSGNESISGKLFLVCPRLHQGSEDLGYSGALAQFGKNG
jgi:hypothetical protein